MKGNKKEILLATTVFLQKLATAAADVLWLLLMSELIEEMLQGSETAGRTGKMAGCVLGMLLLSVWKRMGYNLGRSLTLRLQNILWFRLRCLMTEKIAKVPYRLLEDYAFCELRQVLKENIEGNALRGFVWFIVQKSGNFMLYCARTLGVSLLLGWAYPPLGFLFFLLEMSYCLMTAQGKWQEASLLNREHDTPQRQYMEELALGQAGAGERCLFSYTGYISGKCDREAEASRKERYAFSLECEKREFARQGLQTIACVLIEFALAALIYGGRISLGYFIALSVGACSLIEKNDEGDALYYLQRGRLFLKHWDKFMNLPETEGTGERAEGVDGRRDDGNSRDWNGHGEAGSGSGRKTERSRCGGTKEDSERGDGKDCWMGEPDTLEFRNVSFRYPRTGRYVLRNLNFVLTEGGYYAFVGANGSGKTTIAKLLSGMYDNYEGEILWNGIELRAIPFQERCGVFAILFQDAAKYQDTIAQNIVPREDWETFKKDPGKENQFGMPDGDMQQGGLGKSDAGREKQEGRNTGYRNVEGIDKRQLAEELVREWSAGETGRFPQGADTFLGNMEGNGVMLSAGEWQQLMVAREFAQPARIRVLDEPMAALDVFRQSKVYEQFTKDTGNHTTLLFSHHMAAVRNAKRIFVLEKGVVAEEGSHRQLMCKKGLYAKMCVAQKTDALE